MATILCWLNVVPALLTESIIEAALGYCPVVAVWCIGLHPGNIVCGCTSAWLSSHPHPEVNKNHGEEKISLKLTNYI